MSLLNDSKPMVVIGFTDQTSPLSPVWPSTHRALLPIGGKALIVHTIEQLVDSGMTHIRIAASARQQPVRSRLGDGAEWGATIRYSDLHGADLCTQTLLEHGHCLYLPADQLHLLENVELDASTDFQPGDPSVRDDASVYWKLQSGEPVRASLSGVKGYDFRLPLQSVEAYHRANLEAALGAIGKLNMPGRPIRELVTVDWDTEIAATARLGAGVAIGKHCRVGSRVHLESNCVVGNGVVIGANSHLRNVTILPNTFVGADTRLRDAVLTPCGIFDLNGQFLSVNDTSVLGRARGNHELRTGLPGEGRSELERSSRKAGVRARIEHWWAERSIQGRSRKDNNSSSAMSCPVGSVESIAGDGTRREAAAMKVAIVHDWCVVYGGAERVLEHIIDCYPDADVFSLIDRVPEDQRGFLRGKKPITSFLQKIPHVDRVYRKLLFLLPFAIEQFDLGEYDLIVSSSYCVAKGVMTGPNQVHVSYCHSPMRYAWDHYHEYLRESNLETGPLSWFARRVLHKIRNWDVRSSNTVDWFIANSRFVQARIQKFYRRDSELVFPPVETGVFKLQENKQNYYVAAGRFVPFKRLDLAVDAFTKMPGKHLVMIGDGPDMAKLKEKAGPNIEFIGFQPPQVMNDYLSQARALIFPSEEDFGILPVEAQACGTPVIAFGSGGALETVIGLHTPEAKAAAPTGIFFGEQLDESLIGAVEEFEASYDCFSAAEISAHAAYFGPERFKRQLREQVDSALKARAYAPITRSWDRCREETQCEEPAAFDYNATARAS